MSISTHVLSAVDGVPAEGVEIRLERLDGADASGAPNVTVIGRGVTDGDGRCPAMTEALTLEPGQYRMRFETGAWFARSATATFYPVVEVTFEVTEASAHYHVPLLLSPFAYSTYRGS
jgi:5-hydroxyisourate hydrolase